MEPCLSLILTDYTEPTEWTVFTSGASGGELTSVAASEARLGQTPLELFSIDLTILHNTSQSQPAGLSGEERRSDSSVGRDEKEKAIKPTVTPTQ